MDKMISVAIQRGAWNMFALLPQLQELKSISLDVILKNLIPLILMHLQYLVLKKHADKNNPDAMLHPNFLKKLASCKDQEEFQVLAEATKEKLQLPPSIQAMVNMVKFKTLANDLSDQFKILYNSQLTSKRIYQITEFAMNLSKSRKFKHQLYEHTASIFALLEQDSSNILTHFSSLISLGQVTNRLARQYKWDMDYIHRVRNLYKMQNHDATQWFVHFNKYLERRATHRNAGNYFKVMLNDAIRPGPKFNLQEVQIPEMTDQLFITENDIKMISCSTDILTIPGTIHQLERTFSTSVQVVDGEQMSSVEEILSQVSADTNSMSRATSIVNDETQRTWQSSATDTDEYTDDESIVLRVCGYYDGEESRLCGAFIDQGETRCELHKNPEYTQPMELIKYMKEIEPGRAFSIMKDVIMEVPRPKPDIHATYANSVNGDTKNFMNSFTNFRKLLDLSFDAFPGLGQPDTFKNFNAQPFIQAFEEINLTETKWYAVYQSIKEMLLAKNFHLNMPWINYAYQLANKQGRIQGYLTMDRTEDNMMSREDRVLHWNQAYTKTILDPAIFRPEVNEKAPALYLTNNKTNIPAFLNHACDGQHSQMGRLEKGFYQSENSEPIFGIFHDQRPLQYENPSHKTNVTKKALVMIQVEMDTTSQVAPEIGKFHDRLNMTGSDRVEKIKVQLKSIEANVGIETRSYDNLDSLARDINEPTLQQEDLDTMLKQLDGSQLTEKGYIAHSQYQDFARAIEGNHKNHTKARANAESRHDLKDIEETDKHFVAACHFNLEMHQCPKNLLMFIKITKYLNERNVHVLFMSSAQMTWSRSLRRWRGGFLQIRTEIMKNPTFQDFREDFGLANPELGSNPMVMEVLGDTKLYFGTYRYTLGMVLSRDIIKYLTNNIHHKNDIWPYIKQKP